MLVSLQQQPDTFTEIGSGWKDSNTEADEGNEQVVRREIFTSVSRPRVNHLVRVESRIFSSRVELRTTITTFIHFKNLSLSRERERIRYDA